MEKYKNITGLKYNSQKNEVMLTEEYREIEAIVDASTLILNKGCFCNHPVQAWGDISINQGAVVIGSVYSGRNVNVYSGRGNRGQITSIVGDITAETLKINQTNDDTLVIIFGNIYVDNLYLNAQTFIRGNLYVDHKFECKNRSFVTGMSKLGNPESWCESYIEKFGTFGLSAFGSLTIGSQNTVLEPIITVNPAKKDYGGVQKAQMKILKDNVIRVISVPCTRCLESNDFLRCPKLGSCKNYSVLTNQDIFSVPSEKSYYISWYWRALPETILHHYFIEEFYNIFLIRFNDDEIKYLLNNPDEFKNMYQKLLKQVINIDDSAVALKNWLERHQIPSNKILKYFNIKDQKTIKEVFVSADSLVSSSSSSVSSSGEYSASEGESSTSLTYHCIDIANSVFSGECTLEKEILSLPDIEDIEEFLSLSEDPLENYDIEISIENINELLSRVNLIVEKYENADSLQSKDFVHDFAFLTSVYDTLRHGNDDLYNKYKEQFHNVLNYIKHEFEDFIGFKLKTWYEYFEIGFHQENIPQIQIETLKLFVDLRKDQLIKLKEYLQSLIRSSSGLSLATSELSQALQITLSNIEGFITNFEAWLSSNPAIKALLDYKSALVKYYEPIQKGNATLELLNIIESLRYKAENAGLEEMVDFYDSQRNVIEDMINVESVNMLDFKRFIQSAQIKIKNNEIDKKLIQKLQDLIKLEKQSPFLQEKERKTLKKTIKKILSKRSAIKDDRITKLNELILVSSEISYEDLQKTLKIEDIDDLKSYLKDLIQTQGLNIRLATDHINILEENISINDEISEELQILGDCFDGFEETKKIKSSELNFKEFDSQRISKDIIDRIFSQKKTQTNSSNLYLNVFHDGQLYDIPYIFNPSLILRDQIMDVVQKINFTGGNIYVFTQEQGIRITEIDGTINQIVQKYGNILGIYLES